ncbi:MAG TPA: hypothetical protein VGV67_14960 [Solirubrobacteraceae bacterium]|nr:hypothetical protein [Solirubrobacteraceae bacterium]
MSAAMRRWAAPALLALATALAGCGGDDNYDFAVEEAPTTTSSGVAPAAGGTASSDPLRTGAARSPRLTITVDDAGRDMARYRAPRSVRGGLVEIRLRNVGDVPRKAQLWRIDGDHTVKEALRYGRRLPDWLRTAGGVSLTEPGATSATLQALPAGRYYVASTIGEPGKVAEFEVTSPQRAPEPPRAPARVEALDFSFRVSGLKAGRNSVDFDNTGREPHHAYFTPMRAGSDLGDVRRFFGSRTSTGPPPVDSEVVRETVIVEGGDRQVTQLDFAPGRYAVICFVRGRRGGPRHIELGMINEVTVR